MKILLTGASGFLGSHTAKELCRRDHEVFALVRPTSRRDHLESLGVQLVEGALPDCQGLEPTLNKVDAVIHVAGIVKALSQREFNQVNAQGTENLANKVLQATPRPRFFLHVSSIAVHNPQEGKDFCLPSEQCNPLSHYGQSKLKGELALKPLSGKVRTVILRPPVLYGPGDTEILPLFKALSRGFAPLFQEGNNQVSLCYIEDVARAIADLIEKNLSSDEIYCLDDGATYSLRGLARNISEILGKKAQMIHLPYPAFFLAAGLSQTWAQIRRKPAVFTLNKLKEIKQSHWVCGAEKLHNHLGWEARVPLREGMTQTLAYYRETGLL